MPNKKPVHRFQKETQPTPEQKSAGRARRREAQKIMDQIMHYGGMTIGEMKKIQEKKGDDLTVFEARLMEYVTNKKYIIDRIDRHVPKAPSQTEISGIDGSSIDFNVMSTQQLLELIKKK